MPKSNVEFWQNKIHTNFERDAVINKKLTELGWTVFVVWECDLKSKNREQTLSNLYNSIALKK